MFQSIQATFQSLFYLQKAVSYSLSNKKIKNLLILAIAVNMASFVVSIIAFWITYSIIFLLLLEIFDVQNIIFRVTITFASFLLGVWSAFLLYGVINSIFNAPVYSQIADTIIKDVDAVNNDEFQVKWQKALRNAVVLETKKVFISLVFFIVGFFVSLIPLIGGLLGFFIFLLNVVLISSLEILEPIFAPKNIGVRGVYSAIQHKPHDYLPYILSSGVITSIPFVNTVTQPISIVGAVLLYHDKPLFDKK